MVNTDQRLQSAAKENQILISEAAYIKVIESFNCVNVGQVVLKNKALPATAYAVID